MARKIGDISLQTISVLVFATPTPSPAAEGDSAGRHYPGTNGRDKLKEFVATKIAEAAKDRKIHVHILEANISGTASEVKAYSNEEWLNKTNKYYQANLSILQPEIIRLMVDDVNKFTAPSAKLKFAGETANLEPVLKYFKIKSNQTT